MTRKWASIDEIRQANTALGQCWFSPDTMRWWSSIVHADTLTDGRYFVTSEKPGDERRFTIRVADDDGRIDTVGEYGAYETKDEAVAALRRMTGKELGVIGDA